jgi:fructokinase
MAINEYSSMENAQQILSIGEILIDIFPNYERIGGAPFNFAYHLKNLGMPVRFISRIGNDGNGGKILKFLSDNDFPVKGIQIDKGNETGTVSIEDVAYDYIEYSDILVAELSSSVRLIYFGSLIQRSEAGFTALHAFLSERPRHVKCLYDINLRPGCHKKSIVVTSLRNADILKLNCDELEVVRQMLGFKYSPSEFIPYLFDTYGLDMVSLTKGADGSELFLKNRHLSIPFRSSEVIVDTVGAGDAYTAILAIGYLKNWGLEKILSGAGEFANHICSIEGAIPPMDDFIYRDFTGKIL